MTFTNRYGLAAGLVRRSALTAIVLAVFFPFLLHAKARKPSEIVFSLEPSTVTAGRTLAVWCRSDLPFKNAALYFKDRKAPLYRVDKRNSRAFLGIPSVEDPGTKEISVYAELPHGKIFQTTVTFQVIAGTYPVSIVGLKPEKDSLILSGQVERDADTLDEVYRDPISRKKLWSGTFVLPTTGTFTSAFGSRRTYARGTMRSAHTGTDIANAVGTPIFAPNRGRVVFAQRLASFGWSVILDHGLGIFSYYVHMKEISVKKGEILATGTPIGLMGAEGLATGPHLHWSFVVSGERVDPLEWTERELK